MRLFLIFVLFCGLVHADVVWKGVTYDDQTVSDLITVITSTSIIPSHPDTKHIYLAQSSLFQIPALAKCNKIIVFDALREPDIDKEERYAQYKLNMIKLTETDPHFAHTKLVFCKEWGHLCGAIKEALKHVKTPFVFIHQHDLVIKKPFDLNGVVATMIANPKIKYVNFSSARNDEPWWNGPVDEVIEGRHFVPLCRSFGWSDRCHVASVNYYLDFVLPQCHETFMERVLNRGMRRGMIRKGKEETQRLYGTYLYGSLLDGFYISHSDGAEKRKKRAMAKSRTSVESLTVSN